MASTSGKSSWLHFCLPTSTSNLRSFVWLLSVLHIHRLSSYIQKLFIQVNTLLVYSKFTICVCVCVCALYLRLIPYSIRQVLVHIFKRGADAKAELPRQLSTAPLSFAEVLVPTSPAVTLTVFCMETARHLTLQEALLCYSVW